MWHEGDGEEQQEGNVFLQIFRCKQFLESDPQHSVNTGMGQVRLDRDS